MLTSLLRRVRRRHSISRKAQAPRRLAVEPLEDRTLLSGFVEFEKLTAKDGAAGDRFGFSVAASGDTVVAGAVLDDDNGTDSGSAYVYRFDGTSSNETKLTASDGAAVDFFGWSVAASGDTVVVGAPLDDDNGTDTGSAYVYRFDGTSSNETKLTASDGAAGDGFGESVAASGDTVVVGASRGGAPDSGSAYVYRFDGTSWVEEAKLTASDAAVRDQFGASVAASGDTVVVGAPLHDDNGTNSGSAYVYRFDGTSWNEAKLTASDGAAGDSFGRSVAVSGDTVVVGANGDDDAGTNSGSAYVYRFDGTSWVEETKLTASDAAAFDVFGFSVAASADTVVVGALLDDDNGSDSGSAYVYRFDGTSWIETKLLASDGATRDFFGWSVAASGDTVVVGAQLSGSAYVFVDAPFDNLAEAEAAVNALLTKVEGLGISTEAENSLTGKLEAVLQQLGIEVPQSGGLVGLLDAFIIGVNNWFDLGALTEEERDDLIADAEVIQLGVFLLLL